MTKIPHTLHVYWEGPLPFLALLTVRSFRLWHPTWEIVLHVPDDVSAGRHAITWDTQEHSIPYVGPDYTEDLRRAVDRVQLEVSGHYPPSVRADACRASILVNEGGVWSDMDVLWVRPLDTLAQLGDADVATVFGDGLTGVICTVPGTPYFAKFQHVGQQRLGTTYQAAGPEALLACGVTREDVAAAYPGLRVVGLPPETFYPVPWSPDLAPFVSTVVPVPAGTVCIHWHGGSPKLAQFVNHYATPEALRHVRTTLTVEAQRMGLL